MELCFRGKKKCLICENKQGSTFSSTYRSLGICTNEQRIESLSDFFAVLEFLGAASGFFFNTFIQHNRLICFAKKKHSVLRRLPYLPQNRVLLYCSRDVSRNGALAFLISDDFSTHDLHSENLILLGSAAWSYNYM